MKAPDSFCLILYVKYLLGFGALFHKLLPFTAISTNILPSFFNKNGIGLLSLVSLVWLFAIVPNCTKLIGNEMTFSESIVKFLSEYELYCVPSYALTLQKLG